ncbi:NAD(+) synthase [Tepiditoga spiralis]|uniref:NAD(+) synthase n=1 Tax=Tepiditoga spiralis TaxID=2108365 RepID=A0A7G1G5N2_9BACT|nr:ExsB family protein [Tepiditoga spiralis]BBE31900.1 NAD(+) synthase [Tepiditoga spiralis]
MFTIKIIEEIKEDIKQVVGNKKLYIAFSGGLDSTVVALLAKDALPKSQITLVNVCFGAYSYSKGLEAVLSLSNQMNLNLFFVSGESEQETLMYHGPNCNQCTKSIKIEKVKEFAYKGIVASGANQSDSWGKTKIKIMNNIYSPLVMLNKIQIKEILSYYGFTIPKIGENIGREGCKFKHLLKMAVNTQYHSRADVISNEVIHDVLDFYEFKREIANVKIIGPLSKNIAIINIKPLPPQNIINDIVKLLEKESTIDEVVVANKPMKLKISASPGISNNKESSYWIKTGRLQPEFAVPIEVEWLPSKNNKLRTFSVIDYEFIK